MTRCGRAAFLGTALIVVSGTCVAQTFPIPTVPAECATPPSGQRLIGPPENCFSFQALAGQELLSTCSGYSLLRRPPFGQQGIACKVSIGLQGGDVFASASATNGDTAHLYYTVPQTGTYLLDVLFIGRVSIFGSETFTLDLLSPRLCVGDAASLCLWASRFRVTANRIAPDGSAVPAAAVPLTRDTGSFWFFDASNIEIVAKVLNGCATNGHYWFFASGLTNVGARIEVTDILSGTSRTYANTDGTPFAPVQDVAAFATCP